MSQQANWPGLRFGYSRKAVAVIGFTILCMLASLAGVRAAQADTISVRAAEWCPYVCTPGSDRPGYLIEIAERAFADAGHQLDYQLLPYARAIAQARLGTIDAVAGSGRDDTPDFVLSKSMGLHIPALAMRKGSGFRFEGIHSLEKILLGTTVGVVSWGGGLDEYIATNKDDPTRIDFTGGEDSMPISIRKLIAGRIDAIANNELVLRWGAMRLGVVDQMEFHPITRNDDVYYAFSPANPKSAGYARILEDGVARLRASGELAQIMGRYGITDWAP